MDNYSFVTRKNYNRMSKNYDLIAAPSEKRFKDIGIEMLDVQPGMKVLELGCGTGYALEKFLKSVGETGEVIGIDLSEGMLAKAQTRIAKTSLKYKPQIFQGNILFPPIKKNHFDKIFMSFVLEIIPEEEIQTALEVCRTLLKYDGQICVVSIQNEKGLPISIYQWAHKNFPNVVDCRPIELEKHLLDAGFDLIKKRREKMWGLPIEIILAK